MIFTGVIFTSTIVAVIIMSKSRGTWLALISSISLLLLTSKKIIGFITKPSTSVKVIGLLSIMILIFISGKYIYSLNKESVSGRTLIAKITLQEIIDKPLLGHGIFTFPGGYNSVKANYFSSQNRPWDEIKVGDYVYSAFNDYLMIGYEFGLLVLLLIVFLGVMLFLKSKITIETRLGMALVLNIAVWALFNTILGSVSIILIGILGLSLIFLYGDLNKDFFKTNFHLNKNVLLALVFSFSCLGIYVVSTKIYGVKKFKNYYTQNRGLFDKEQLIRLSKPLENNRNNDFELGKALYKLGYLNESYGLMEKSFKKTSLPTNGRQLAEFYSKNGNYNRANEIYQFNINVEPYRYEPQMDHISLLEKTNNYNEIVKRSHEIIEFPVKIPSQKVNEYKELSKKRVEKYSKYVDSSSILKGTLSKPFTIKSKLLNKKLLYKIYLPPISLINKKLPIVYINDGRSYIKKGHAVKVLDSLINNNIIKPIAAVFLEPRDGNRKWKNVRQELFLCNPTFVDFFLEEFMSHIERKYPISNLKKDRTIMGMSFGGLAAAYIANTSPNSFKNVIMQSPAFHPCPEIYKVYSKEPKRDFKMYLSYGTGKDTEKQDLPMIRILNEKDYKLKVERVEGGNHTWDVWKEQLDDIFMYYFKK
ncbi:alpha/beta hydrolase-fold protein [Flavivirga aquimarina]|uniref:Alpha/beta hydrolase-fold protein n=1 Tax=Flavivirga aquimarina TaxID=2027862 RepID=A0ABT8W5I4_9FLAO|nr:alpha/beta hydrolase-fold protein [Flavivirga aquimarina]MDO5968366.1 alpha/beta hydrolase-fold protein [Flavivirga aquimarina]